jgi:hypothetical protein
MRRGFKQSCNFHLEFSNNMWHATFMHIIHNDSWFLMVRNQIDTLTPGSFFGHNLCYKHSNGSCELTSDIYISKVFQWYKEFFNLMSFDPSNHSLKIWESIGTPTPIMEIHLGVFGLIPSHYRALPGVWMWLLGCILGPHFSMPLFWSQAQGCDSFNQIHEL